VLLGVCRREDHVIRWGGDEFVVITEMVGIGQAQALAERIRAKIAAHDFVLDDDLVVRTTCSIGFATYPLHRARSDASNFDRIIRLADGMMYEAKKKRDAWVGTFDWVAATGSFELDAEAAESVEALLRAQTRGLVSILEPDDDARAPRSMGVSS
jgi:GGDEF domain-containing protein